MYFTQPLFYGTIDVNGKMKKKKINHQESRNSFQCRNLKK
jgi:hypothetical protein